MHRLALLFVCISVSLVIPSITSAQTLPEAFVGPIDFVKDIQPILRQHCWSCHGAEKQESGLRLDRRDLMLLGGDLGKVLAPGKSETSRLIHYVAGVEPDHLMPPEGDRLSAEQIALLRAWIDAGCEWPESANEASPKNSHWAYEPLRVQPAPDVKQSSSIRNDIDRFVLAELEKHGLSPSPEASRYTLIRRLSLDLTGLLPSLQEVDAFVNDVDPEAYEKLADRFLASPHFGERWGRHWLDMARYADSDGYEKDNPRPDAYRWRDWVIDAINADMPFDQFTVEQLAGDLLPDATPMQRLATAFHRQTLTNTEGGTDQEQFRVEACFDRTETTGTIWLGLTVGCARCHTHKYDAITQREYYQLFSVFNNGDETNFVVPRSSQEVEAYAGLKAAYDGQWNELSARLETAQKESADAFQNWQTTAKATLAAAAANPAKLHSMMQPGYSGDPGLMFQPQPDGSVLVGGDNPERASYTIAGQTNVQNITGIRLDVLPDSALPANGPGRVAHGNFVLSELSMEVSSDAAFTNARPVKFSAAKADFEQADGTWKASEVIDGKDETGWAIAPQFGKEHWLVLGLAEPLSAVDILFVRFRLHQQYGKQHTIGRFRISLRTGVDPEISLPENILQALHLSADKRTPEQAQLLFDYFSRQTSPTKELLAQQDELRKTEPPKPEVAARVIAQRVTEPRSTYVLRRGEFLNPIQELQVVPAGLATMPVMQSRQPDVMADRLDLARWLVSPENPLTPRVSVNHVWRLLFGHGMVKTSNDFGVRGERPSHPELLDWLASDFLAGSGSGRPWSRKALIRRIVLSGTYRQASFHRADLQESDPQNRLLARQNRLRVEAEIIRDISLDVSGLLSHKIGGPSVFPPLPPGIAELSYAGNFNWAESKGEDRYRRGMYTFFKRTSPHPNLIAFDCPDANLTCVERQISNTPLQALTSLNNETFSETARAFARRILSLPETTDEERLVTAFRLCVSRSGSASELTELTALLNDSKRWYEAHPDQAVALIGADPVPNTAAELNAAWIATARILLNMDEFITRE